MKFPPAIFQSLRALSGQPKERPAAQRFGKTANLRGSLRFTTSTDAPLISITLSAKFFPQISTVARELSGFRKAGPVYFYHFNRSVPAGNIGGCHVNRIRKAVGICRDMPLGCFCPRHSPFFGGIRVSRALRVNNAKRSFIPS
jgi:hypothetical protein